MISLQLQIKKILLHLLLINEYLFTTTVFVLEKNKLPLIKIMLFLYLEFFYNKTQISTLLILYIKGHKKIT